MTVSLLCVPIWRVDIFMKWVGLGIWNRIIPAALLLHLLWKTGLHFYMSELMVCSGMLIYSYSITTGEEQFSMQNSQDIMYIPSSCMVLNCGTLLLSEPEINSLKLICVCVHEFRMIRCFQYGQNLALNQGLKNWCFKNPTDIGVPRGDNYS